MKKRFILLFLFSILISSFASAEIVFNDDFEKYNLGDVAKIEGYITINSDVRNILRIYLDCDNSLQLSARMINVKANEKYYFNENVNLFGEKGECVFRATFNSESKRSKIFEITDDLRGTLFISKNSLKLGDTFEITGDVFTINNNKFNGIGIISLNDKNESYFVDTFNIYGGEIKYNNILEKLPARSYDVRIEAFDFYGNQKKFDLGVLKVNDKLPTILRVDKSNYLPGEKIGITGNVDAKNYRVIFEFDGKKFDEPYTLRDFNYILNVRENIKSGDNKIKVKVNDDYGNYYEEELGIIITGVPKLLDVKINQESYLPENKVEIFSGIYDQGNDIYEDAIKIIVFNPKNNIILDTNVNSGSVYGLNIEKYATPGNYKVLAEGSTFKKEIGFTVSELVKINAYYDENRLKIINEGNIDIDDYFTVTLNGNTYSIDINVKPSEIESYDLRDKIKKDGYYDLNINYKGQIIDLNQEYMYDDRGAFEKLTGSVVGEGGIISSWVVYVLLLIIIFLLAYMFVFKKPNDNHQRDRDYREGQEKLKRVRSQREIRKTGRKSMFPSKEINEEEAKQFRESMVNKMKGR